MTATRSPLYLDDFTPGQKFSSGNFLLDAAAITDFAAQFDPQPFHLDDSAAADSLFRGLAASGWHTASATMKLLVASDFRPAGGLVGAGIEELRWPQPVRPGDVLSIDVEVLEVRASRSRPQQGIVRILVETRNQRDELVQRYIGNIVVKRNPARFAG